jgi:hypothetical protein
LDARQAQAYRLKTCRPTPAHSSSQPTTFHVEENISPTDEDNMEDEYDDIAVSVSFASAKIELEIEI